MQGAASHLQQQFHAAPRVCKAFQRTQLCSRPTAQTPASCASSAAVLPCQHTQLQDAVRTSCSRSSSAVSCSSPSPFCSPCSYRSPPRSSIQCNALALSAAPAEAAATAAGMSFSQMLAVGLGYCVLVGSLLRSVPQIAKILKARSCEGLSVTSNIVELLCYTVVLAYNVSQVRPISTIATGPCCLTIDVFQHRSVTYARWGGTFGHLVMLLCLQAYVACFTMHASAGYKQQHHGSIILMCSPGTWHCVATPFC